MSVLANKHSLKKLCTAISLPLNFFYVNYLKFGFAFLIKSNEIGAS